MRRWYFGVSRISATWIYSILSCAVLLGLRLAVRRLRFLPLAIFPTNVGGSVGRFRLGTRSQTGTSRHCPFRRGPGGLPDWMRWWRLWLALRWGIGGEFKRHTACARSRRSRAIRPLAGRARAGDRRLVAPSGQRVSLRGWASDFERTAGAGSSRRAIYAPPGCERVAAATAAARINHECNPSRSTPSLLREGRSRFPSPKFGAREGGRYSAGRSASGRLEVDACGTGGRSGDTGFADGG
jgi:hypothetical protein